MSRCGDQTNILRLYAELDVQPEDGIERLTERYRQRLRELHPDAAPQRRRQADLGWLTSSYREALAFAREHGRLPGAEGRPAVAAQRALVEAKPARPASRTPRRRRPRMAPTQPGKAWRWLVAIITVVAVTLATAPELLDVELDTAFERPRPSSERTPR